MSLINKRNCWNAVSIMGSKSCGSEEVSKHFTIANK